MPSYGAGTKNACLVGSHNSPRRKLVVPHRVRRVLVSLLYCGMLNNVRRVEWASLQRSLPSLANESFTTTSPWRSTRKKMARTLGAQTGIMVRKQQKNTTTPFSHLSIPWSLPFILSLSLSLSTVVAFPSESAAAAWARLRLEPWGSLASPLRSCRLGSPALVPAAQTSDSSPLHRGMCFSEIPLVCRYKHARIHELLEIRENHELVQAPEPLCFSVICIHCLISWSS
jgi:hypothetical protein